MATTEKVMLSWTSATRVYLVLLIAARAQESGFAHGKSKAVCGSSRNFCLGTGIYISSPSFPLFAPVIFAFFALARGLNDLSNRPASIISLLLPCSLDRKANAESVVSVIYERGSWLVLFGFRSRRELLFSFFFPSFFTPSTFRIMRHARSARFFADGNNVVRRVKLSRSTVDEILSRKWILDVDLYSRYVRATCDMISVNLRAAHHDDVVLMILSLLIISRAPSNLRDKKSRSRVF